MECWNFMTTDVRLSIAKISVIRPVKLTLFPQMVYGCQKEIIGHDSEPRMLITADVSTLFF
ncbi:Uncharacterized protein APZ42_032902 [Daphnia magna]|uniref:Uncharacterized protein n=1 Tax=Daphnia magna TaxID=35525 RepID=A0A164LXP0_9CRUS|nr:Uncharacterized protein APZ42_032902 [Daphnia magna]